MPLFEKIGCEEYLTNFRNFEKECNFTPEDIPQMNDINE